MAGSAAIKNTTAATVKKLVDWVKKDKNAQIGETIKEAVNAYSMYSR